MSSLDVSGVASEQRPTATWAASLLHDATLLTAAEAMAGRPDFSLDTLLASILEAETAPNHPYHVYTASGLTKAELQALAGTDGPSREMLDDWRRRFPPPGSRGSRKSGSSK